MAAYKDPNLTIPIFFASTALLATFFIISFFNLIPSRTTNLHVFFWIILVLSFLFIICLAFWHLPNIFWKPVVSLLRWYRLRCLSARPGLHLNQLLSIICLQLHSLSFWSCHRGLRYLSLLRLSFRQTAKRTVFLFTYLFSFLRLPKLSFWAFWNAETLIINISLIYIVFVLFTTTRALMDAGFLYNCYFLFKFMAILLISINLSYFSSFSALFLITQVQSSILLVIH